MSVLSLLKNCLRQPYDGDQVVVSGSQFLNNEFTVNIRSFFAYLEPRLGTINIQIIMLINNLFLAENNDLDHRHRFVGLCCLAVLHFQIFRVLDKKFLKGLWDIHKKVESGL